MRNRVDVEKFQIVQNFQNKLPNLAKRLKWYKCQNCQYRQKCKMATTIKVPKSTKHRTDNADKNTKVSKDVLSKIEYI